MKRTMLTLALVAATAAPALASAQSAYRFDYYMSANRYDKRLDLNNDRRVTDRELRVADRNRDGRISPRELQLAASIARETRQMDRIERREARRWARGQVLDRQYRQSNFMVNDWQRYGWQAPQRGYAYYRTDTGEVVMAAIATGVISSIVTQALTDNRRDDNRRGDYRR